MTERFETKSVGVIGLGALGNRLITQEILSGNKVLVFDIDTDAKYSPNQAVDPGLETDCLDQEGLLMAGQEEILEGCSLVHWAVASSQLQSISSVPADCTLVLHDSVMSTSFNALAERQDKNQFVIAHCLMNSMRRVLVSTEFGNHRKVTKHFSDIGLDPRETTVAEHDRIMARSQGIFALLINAGLREELDQGLADGNLTPSANELQVAVANREARWTKQTVESILSNPELQPFIEDMASALKPNTGESVQSPVSSG